MIISLINPLKAGKALCLLNLYLLISVKVLAQMDWSKVELGANAAAYIYQGDLTPSKSGSLKTISLGFGFNVAYKLNDAFFLKTSLAFGKLRGDDSKYTSPAWRQQRNFKFKSPVTEISQSIVYNILKPSSAGGRRLTPYLSAGAGLTFLNIQRDYSDYNAGYFEETTLTDRLQADLSKRLPKTLIVFPVGAGVRYAINDHISLNFESLYRLNSTDYLDGFSQSGNAKKKDHYYTNALGFIYNFGKKNILKCPPVRL